MLGLYSDYMPPLVCDQTAQNSWLNFLAFRIVTVPSLVPSSNKLSGNNWLKIKIFYMTSTLFSLTWQKWIQIYLGPVDFATWLYCAAKPISSSAGAVPPAKFTQKSQALQLAAPMPLAPPDMLGHHCCRHWHHSRPLDTGCYWSNQCGALPSPNTVRFICHLNIFMAVYVTSSSVWSWGLAEPCSCTHVLTTTLFGKASIHSL